jgi:hypothetical protein
VSARRIKVTAGGVTVFAALNDTDTADAVWDDLPIKARASKWGDEIYFSTPVHDEGDHAASDVVPLGAVGYWPPGNALCLFFGPTPASRGNEPRGASPITVIGQVEGDCNVLKKVPSGAAITVERT